MKRVDSAYSKRDVVLQIDNIKHNDSIRIMIGIADNGTLAVWNNADGEQVNIPLSELSVIDAVRGTQAQLEETKDIIDYKECYGITSHHEYNPAHGTCPFCGNHVMARNIDFWNGKIVCECGAKLSNGKATKKL